MTRRKTPVIPMTRIVRDSRDYTRDYELPTARVKELYAQGKIGYSPDLRGYCHLVNDPYARKLT